MGRHRKDRVEVEGASIWPQPKRSRRQRYRVSYGVGEHRRTVVASTDIDVTAELARALVRNAERARLGLPLSAEDRFFEHAAKPLPDHVAEWVQALRDQGRDPKHVRQAEGYVSAILFGTPRADPTAKRKRGSVTKVSLSPLGVVRIDEIDPVRVQRQLAVVKRATGNATANRYLDHLGAFLGWGVEKGRWGANPCGSVARFSRTEERKVVRRVIPVAEFARLVQVTEAGPVRGGATGKERSRNYRLAVATALRAGELRKLIVEDLRNERSGILLPPHVDKKRHERFIGLPPSIVAELLWSTGGKTADAPLVKLPTNLARVLRADLKAAGIEYRTRDGTFDFHAVRHASGAYLLSAGANPKAVQAHMRHRSIRTTLDTYGHLLDSDRQASLNLLSSFDQELRNLKRETPNGVRSGSPEFVGEGEESRKNTGKTEWSDGESNPDLLNAIQPSSR